jgi:hypothetical protein
VQFYSVLTLQIPGHTVTVDAVVTVTGNDATRQELMCYMRDQAVERCGQQFAKAYVMFFSAEPNIITA